jgi:hypothetical protein
MEIPICPESGHAGSRVVRAGWYGRPGQRRQRWLCTPAQGAAHRFTEVLPRIVTGSVAPVCPDCATTLEAWEGQPAPRLYGFTARDVAAALAMVAGGASYRDTAEAIRVRAGRPLSTAPGRTPPRGRGRKQKKGKVVPAANRHPQLVSDWVEVFAPMIWDAYAPAAWPARLAIDESEFRYSRASKARGERAFCVLAAVGYDDSERPYVAGIEAVPSATLQAWSRFLGSRESRPEWVVGDGGNPLRAVAAAWPAGPPDEGGHVPVQTWRCEWHLAHTITQALPNAVRRDRTDPIHQLIPEAVRTIAGWQKAVTTLSRRTGTDTGCQGAITALLQIRNLVAAQELITIRGPRSTGAVEEFFRQLENTLGDRVSRLTNKTRADALLKLVAARRNGWLDEPAWAELIREHLATSHGRAPDQRRHTDPKNSPSLRIAAS